MWNSLKKKKFYLSNSKQIKPNKNSKLRLIAKQKSKKVI